MTNPKQQAASAATIESLADELFERVIVLPQGQRYILGITGAPGAGKSTVSEWIVDAVKLRLYKHITGQDRSGCMQTIDYGDKAVVVPMDGFHFSNEKLKELKLLDLKGIPDTFDAVSFVNLLRKLRTTTDKNVYAPLFDRSIEASIEDAIVIEPRHKLCVVEGNYLLLDTQPWDECRRYLDQTWFLEVDMETIVPRLQERHHAGGRSPDAAKAKMESTDLPNAKLIEDSKKFAHKLIKLG